MAPHTSGLQFFWERARAGPGFEQLTLYTLPVQFITMITNIDIDQAVVADAMRLSGARSKREVVDRALRELVARATRPSIRELFGIGGVDPDYDPKAPWARGDEVGQFRAEQPRAVYPAAAQAKAAAAKVRARAPAPAPAKKPVGPAKRARPKKV